MDYRRHRLRSFLIGKDEISSSTRAILLTGFYALGAVGILREFVGWPGSRAAGLAALVSMTLHGAHRILRDQITRRCSDLTPTRYGTDRQFGAGGSALLR